MTVLLPSRNNHMRKCFIYFFENNGKASSDQREIVLYLLKKETNRNQQRLESTV